MEQAFADIPDVKDVRNLRIQINDAYYSTWNMYAVYELELYDLPDNGEMDGEVGVPSPEQDISIFFNNYGISDDARPSEANYDTGGSSYSYQALKNEGLTPGGPIAFDGMSFKWPDRQPGTLDNIVSDGQTIMFSAAGSKLGFIGSAAHGPSIGTGTIQYEDETVEEFQLGFSDWTLGGGASEPSFDNEIVASMPYRNTQTEQENTETYLFYTSVPVKEGVKVTSVTLPDANSIDRGIIHLFAVSIDAETDDKASILALQQHLRNDIESGDVKGPLVHLLENKLRQVEHHYDKQALQQALKHLNDFVKHLNKPGNQEYASEQAREQLTTTASPLIERWTKESS